MQVIWKKRLSKLAFIGTMALTAFLCVSLQGSYATNGNISWLLMGAERLLQGQSMSGHIYEPNPPLSLLIYIPHVLFAHLVNLPLTIGSFYVTGFFVLLSVIASALIIGRYTFLNEAEKLAFTTCYAIAVTLSTTLFFSEREHLLILGLAPFILAQFAFMEKIPLPRLLQAIILPIGALAILIKPHYGLAPTVFLIMRLVKYKQYNLVKAPDFIALSTLTLLYIAYVITAFSDYVAIILPDVLSFYIGSSKDYSVILETTMLQTTLFLCAFIAESLLFTDLKDSKRRLTLLLYASALLCLIPYYIQMKGYYNHLIPANSFFLMGLSASLIFRLKKGNPLLPFLCILGVTHLLTPLNRQFPTHKEMQELPVAQFLKEKFLEQECTKPCSVFTFHTDMEIMPPTAALMGYTYASRFGSFWPLPDLIKKPNTPKTIQTKERYARYIIEDLEYYKPSILLIVKGETPFEFIEFFNQSNALPNYIATHYDKQPAPFSFDRAAYFKGTTMDKPYILTYDVFLKTNNDDAI